jgi:hypothetical protein
MNNNTKRSTTDPAVRTGRWIFTRPGEFKFALLVFLSGIGLLILTEYSPSTPAWHLHDLENSLTWKRYVYLVLLALSSLKVVIVPLWNLYVALVTNKGRKLLPLVLSMFPIRYESELDSARKRAHLDIQAGPDFRYSFCRIFIPPVERRTFVKIHGAKKWSIQDPFFTANAGIPRGTVHIVLKDSKAVGRAKGSWLPKFLEALDARLLESAYPLEAIPFVGVDLHSDEQIKKVGEHGYWS